MGEGAGWDSASSRSRGWPRWPAGRSSRRTVGGGGAGRRGRGRATPPRGWGRWLGEPRAAVLIALFLIVVVGGGRKLLRGWRARGGVGRLGAPDVPAGGGGGGGG